MFPGFYKQPSYVITQIKRKCFDSQGAMIHDDTHGIHPLVFRVPPPSNQPLCRRKAIVEKGNQLLKDISQFQDDVMLLLDTQVQDDLSSLSDEELKNRLKEKVHLLADSIPACERMERDGIAEVVTYLEKAISTIQDCSLE